MDTKYKTFSGIMAAPLLSVSSSTFGGSSHYLNSKLTRSHFGGSCIRLGLAGLCADRGLSVGGSVSALLDNFHLWTALAFARVWRHLVEKDRCLGLYFLLTNMMVSEIWNVSKCMSQFSLFS